MTAQSRWWSVVGPFRVAAVIVVVCVVSVACGGSGEVVAPAVPFTDVAVGEDHACGLRVDGQVEVCLRKPRRLV